MIGYDEIRYDRYACLNFLTLLGCLTHMIPIWVHEETQVFTVHHERSKCRKVCRQAYQLQDTKIGRIRTHRHITLWGRWIQMNRSYSVFSVRKLLRTRDSQGSGSFSSGSRRRSLLDEAAQAYLTKLSFASVSRFKNLIFIYFLFILSNYPNSFIVLCCSMVCWQLKLRSSTAQPALRPTRHLKDRVAKSLNPSESFIADNRKTPDKAWSHNCIQFLGQKKFLHKEGTEFIAVLIHRPLQLGLRWLLWRASPDFRSKHLWWIVDTYGMYTIVKNLKMQDIPRWCFLHECFDVPQDSSVSRNYIATSQRR